MLAGLLAATPLWAERPSGKLKIAAVELLQLSGHRETESGINGQHQVNPLDVYDEYRPKVYQDQTPVKTGCTDRSIARRRSWCTISCDRS
jgi:hypothetical protein